MKLNELVEKAHKNAEKKGWWHQARTPPEIHMLIVTEVSEATEEVRKGRPPIYQGEKQYDWIEPGTIRWDSDPKLKPEGEAVELADVVIRVADYFGAMGWDLEQVVKMKMAHNETRPERHGGKKY